MPSGEASVSARPLSVSSWSSSAPESDSDPSASLSRAVARGGGAAGVENVDDEWLMPRRVDDLRGDVLVECRQVVALRRNPLHHRTSLQDDWASMVEG